MKLALAPMATLSHEALRILIHRYGDPDEYFSEMIHAPSFIVGGPFEKWYVRTAPESEKMVWQLTGPEAEQIVRAAEMIVPLGGIGLDLNMGCSAPDIAKTGAGIGWMLKPVAETANLVRSVRRVADKRLGVKLRLGETDDYAHLLEFCRMLVSEGVDLITLHPRVRREKYSRLAHREYVARLASDLAVPVYGNGDVNSAENALDFMNRFPCAGLMIGRSAVQKPWIFRQIREAESASGVTPEPAVQAEPLTVDHLEIARFFLSTLAESQPAEFQITRARRFFFYYCDNFSFAHYIKMRIQNAKSPDEIGALLGEYFDQVPGDRFRLPE